MQRDSEADKPLVSIVMAVYEPDLVWLREQLVSLNNQTYTNLELLVRDDCSQKASFDKISQLVRECITAFPAEVSRNEINLGTNKTFEILTTSSHGAYIAYCDQDDVWENEKIEVLLEALNRSNSALAYSDMRVIDKDGQITADSLKKVRPRIEYREGGGLLKNYVFENWTAGCSMLIKADIANRAVPFVEGTVYDHWLCIWASSAGDISFISSPLVRYRIHGGNQTGVLKNVTDKKSYYKYRIDPMVRRIEELARRICVPQEVIDFMRARKDGKLLDIWKLRRLCKKEACFEIFMRFIPDGLVKILLRKVKGI